VAAGVALLGVAGVGAGVWALTQSNGPGGLLGIQANAAGLVKSPSGKIVAQVGVPGRPADVAVGEGAVWVSDGVNGTLLRIDQAKRVVVDRVQVGADPAGVAVGGGSVWVANSQDGTISQVNPTTDTVVSTLRVGNGPTSVASETARYGC